MRYPILLLLLAALFVVPSIETPAKDIEGKPASRLEVGPAVVGQPSEIRWNLSRPDTGKQQPSLLTLTITHLEKEKRIFSLEKIPTRGNFTLSFHFTDGAAHRVTAVAEVEGKGEIREEKVIAVTGIDPPPKAIVPSLLSFLGVIALGLVTGRISRGRIKRR
ncbi:MAG: hypothetical protein ACREQA_08090 [Candidatus Binatia bacterium]